ncbi:hypothetical protein IL992_25225 [Microbispora sp. NEAU-D428]|uniref:hypothetical protein n=1 Tax=Microbispora sitophila TaxID=2771537 RepID=UPI001865AB5E|nr:hypothetical protein [Microbispora sitophila]MBE3012470.1 hypothetical protein [Microbispora sitophila]
MNALVTRVVTVSAAVVLASAVTAAPATADDANYTCASGTRFLLSDLLGYIITASGCTGSGTGTWGTITIPSGSYFCQRVAYYPEIDYANGQRC